MSSEKPERISSIFAKRVEISIVNREGEFFNIGKIPDRVNFIWCPIQLFRQRDYFPPCILLITAGRYRISSTFSHQPKCVGLKEKYEWTYFAVSSIEAAKSLSLPPYLTRLAPSDRNVLFVLSVRFVPHNGGSIVISRGELLAGSPTRPEAIEERIQRIWTKIFERRESIRFLLLFKAPTIRWRWNNRIDKKRYTSRLVSFHHALNELRIMTVILLIR